MKAPVPTHTHPAPRKNRRTCLPSGCPILLEGSCNHNSYSLSYSMRQPNENFDWGTSVRRRCGWPAGQTEYDPNLTRPLLEACAAACRSCGDECRRHAEMHEHCRVCAEACGRCKQACADLLGAMQ